MNLTMALMRVARPRRFAAFQEYLRLEGLSTEQLKSRQLAKLSRLLVHAATTVPFYRDHLAGAASSGTRDPRELLADLPCIDKKTITAAPSAFVAEGVASRNLVSNSTGGSTGTIFRFYTGRETLPHRHGVDLYCRSWTGWKPGSRQAMVWGHRGDIARQTTLVNSIKNLLYSRTLLLDTKTMSEETIAAFLERLSSSRITLLVGYSSAVAHLAKYCATHGIIPHHSLLGIITSAETLTEEHRSIIGRVFRCPVLNRYGSREFGVIAQQCPRQRGLHVMSDRLYLEILDPEGRPTPPGQYGEVVLTDLDARSMPLIRYRTGDLVRAGESGCDCGRGWETIPAVEGRTADLLISRDGRTHVWLGPLLFGHDLDGIVQMQVVQDSLMHLTVRLVTGQGWTEENASILARRIRDLLGEVAVSFDYVDHIPPTPSGKHRFVISHISPFEATGASADKRSDDLA